jgi:hypothetical protein
MRPRQPHVAEADVVLAVGTRLQDFTTGSWTVFGEGTRIVALNAARFDATKHLSHPLVGDARECLAELAQALDGWRVDAAWRARAREEATAFRSFVAERTGEWAGGAVPTYAQVVGAVNRLAGPDDLALTAAGGLPGEMNVHWLANGIGTFDCEYGYSTMGYELAGAWGARRARERGEVIAFVGDGSYLMLNSELYSATLAGDKLIVVLCDNGGYAVIHRLQVGQGGAAYNNMLEDVRRGYAPVDWVAHARSLGCLAEAVEGSSELEAAFERARRAARTTVLVIRPRRTNGRRAGRSGRWACPRSRRGRRSERRATDSGGQAPPADRLVTSRDPIRVGVVGVGRIGAMHASMVAGAVPGLALAAVHDADAAAAAAVAGELGVPAFATSAELIEHPTSTRWRSARAPTRTSTCSSGPRRLASRSSSRSRSRSISPRSSVVSGRWPGRNLPAARLQPALRPGPSLRAEAVASGAVGDVHLVRITSRDPQPPLLDYIRVSGGSSWT